MGLFRKKKPAVVFNGAGYGPTGVREITIWPTGVMTWTGRDGEERELDLHEENRAWKWVVRPDSLPVVTVLPPNNSKQLSRDC